MQAHFPLYPNNMKKRIPYEKPSMQVCYDLIQILICTFAGELGNDYREIKYENIN